MSKWPIDTFAGKVVLVIGLALVAFAAAACRLGAHAWLGCAAIAAAVGLAVACRALFFRGFFGGREVNESE